MDSTINAQFNDEEVIPSPGHAKNLKSKFLNFEKEAAKVETSSAKMNYVPKRFTSSNSSNNKGASPPPETPAQKTPAQVNKVF